MSMFHSLLSMGGVTYDADYQAYLDYLTTQSLAHPSTAKKTVENAFMIAVKASFSQSTIAACPILQMLMFKTDAASGASLVNWHNPGTRNATAVNSPTFTSDLGWNSNGTTSYLTSGLTSANINQADFSLCIRAYTNAVSSGTNTAITGSGDPSTPANAEVFQVIPRFTGDLLRVRVYGPSTAIDILSNTDATNRITVGRTDANNIHASINGASFTSVANTANAAEASRDITILGYNGSAGLVGFYVNGVSYRIAFARKLTDGENAAIDAALVNYLA